MQRKNKYIPLCILLSFTLAAACNRLPADAGQTGELLEISPDYTSVTIPVNIAPMNFQVLNQGDAFVAELSVGDGRGIRLRSRTGCMEIPSKAWKRLLEKGKGGTLTITVSRKTDGEWSALAPVKNEISADRIDPYFAFRKIPPANIIWKSMGIYQRSLESFREIPILVNTLMKENCINCHSFNAGDPDQMVVHLRDAYGGTLVKDGDDIQFVNTSSDHTRSAAAYPSWHPDGELIAFSVNMVKQGFHARMDKVLLVGDNYSDIVLFDVKNNSITRPGVLATDKLENLPTWSCDGRKLYYICAEKMDTPVPNLKRHYSLMSIGFDGEKREFGRPDTLISVKDFGRSITYPRESPAGGLISFIGVDYGYFSIHNKEADVFFFHTESGKITTPGINSEFAESYPSWSGNGKWLMFVSKRGDGVLSQVWFSHIDKNGTAGKPFVLPQRHPDFYDEYLYNYNRPEFISGKVDLNPRKVLAIVKQEAESSRFNAASSVSLSTGATIPAEKKEGGFYHHD